ncbi:hypothetical protein CTAYLR_008083 [Chrysophaeum taylorii]|uniref:Replication factor A protein 3 n=1 Tax=Chrysophaeum taylorii TaxID=2483200 RepID=A0AAD7UK76_9STRA|nr:hypothetical protein CTAYLR_008083 [Chrysophaeum taylorii]
MGSEFFETGAAARLNGKMLTTVDKGATVSVVGQVAGPDLVRTSDDVEVRLALSGSSEAMPQPGYYVEVLGTVQNSSCIKPLRVTSFGEQFDLKNYDGLVELANDKYRRLFMA